MLPYHFYPTLPNDCEVIRRDIRNFSVFNIWLRPSLDDHDGLVVVINEQSMKRSRICLPQERIQKLTFLNWFS